MTDQQTAQAPPRRSAQNPSPAVRATRASARAGKLFPLILLVLGVAASSSGEAFSRIPEGAGQSRHSERPHRGRRFRGRAEDRRAHHRNPCREGDTVKAGDTIAMLDDEQIRAREDQAQAALAAPRRRAKSAQRSDRGFRAATAAERICRPSSRRWMRRAGCARPKPTWRPRESDLAQQEASLKLAQFDNDAYQKLVKTGAVSERQAKQAAATADQQAAAVAAARRRVEAARGALTTAQANLSNPGIREFQAATVRKQIAQQQAEIATAPRPTQQARLNSPKRRTTATTSSSSRPSTAPSSRAPPNPAKWSRPAPPSSRCSI